MLNFSLFFSISLEIASTILNESSIFVFTSAFMEMFIVVESNFGNIWNFEFLRATTVKSGTKIINKNRKVFL